jgi:hypothetical protein
VSSQVFGCGYGIGSNFALELLSNYISYLSNQMKKMKNVIFTLSLLFCLQAWAQNANVVVFTEEEEPFTLSVNGLARNTQAASHVHVKDLTPASYRIRVKFQDPSLGVLTKTMFIEPGNEYTVVVRKKKSTAVGGVFKEVGKSIDQSMGNDTKEDDPASAYVMRLLSVAPLQGVVTDNSDSFDNSHPHGGNSGNAQPSSGNPGNNAGGSGSGSVGFNVNVNADGTGFNMNMNVQDGTQGGQINTNVNTNTQQSGNWDAWDQNSGGNGAVTTGGTQGSGTSGCAGPMSAQTFAAAQKTISNQGFDESRLKIAKQAISANCMSVAQIAQVLTIFGFEETKLDFAKYAYDYTSDPKNYFMLNDSFGFSSSVDELEEYLSTKR